MPLNVGVFVDIQNLYTNIQRRFPNKKLDYRKYLSKVTLGDNLNFACAYGAIHSEADNNFINCLSHIGFFTRYRPSRKTNWDAGIAVDVFQRLHRFDRIVLGSSRFDLIPLIEFVQSRGVFCSVVACDIGFSIKEVAYSFEEITLEYLEENSNEVVAPAE